MTQSLMQRNLELAEFYDTLSRIERWRARFAGVRDTGSVSMHKSLSDSSSASREPAGGRDGIDDWLSTEVDAFLRSREPFESDPTKPPRVPLILDIGCGFGASLRKLTKNTAARGVGLTLSPYQRRVAARNSDESLCFMVGNFEDELPPNCSQPDAIVSIETLVYACDLDAAMRHLARGLRPAAGVFVIEDMVESERVNREGVESSLLSEYKRLWQLQKVYSRSDFERAFAGAGLSVVQARDFTPRVQTRHRDELASKIRSLKKAEKLRWPASLRHLNAAYLGGFCLESLYQMGLFSYRFYHLRNDA